MTNPPDNPFVTVIIVAYNYAHFLPRALDACKQQTFKDFELLIVNNGSTDNTQEIIDGFIEVNSQMNIKCHVVDVNIGLPNGRNVGIENATGEYILFNDADDWMAPDCLERLCSIAKETCVDRVVGAFTEVDMSGNHLRVCAHSANHSPWLFTSLQAAVFRRSLLVENNFSFPIKMKVDDIYFHTVFSTYSQSHFICREPIYYYLVNEYSTSGNKSASSWSSTDLIQECFEVLNPFYRVVTDPKDKEVFQYVFIKQFYFFYLHNNRYSRFIESWNNYKAGRVLLMNYFPDYLRNKNLTLFKENGDRPTGRRLMWVISRCEKLHLMPLFILLFTAVSKRKYLNP